MRKIPTSEHPAIISAYQHQSISMIDLATFYGVTRQMIWYILQYHHIITTKAQAGNRTFRCANCGSEGSKHRKAFNATINKFCSRSCYYSFLTKGNGHPYIPSSQGSRTARKLVSTLFPLTYGNIVHHEDRNQNNNNIKNLRVFSNSADHLRYHRGKDISPIWSGAKL